jgi:hypothetical protein
MGFNNVETETNISERWGTKALSKSVCKLWCSPDMKNSNLPQSNLLTNKMKINFDVLGHAMLHGVAWHVNRWNVVTIENGSLLYRTMQLRQEPMEPNCFSNSVVLCFSRRSRNVTCLLEDHGIKLLPRKTQNPNVDWRVSEQPTQSASKYVVKEVGGEEFMWRPWSKVTLR